MNKKELDIFQKVYETYYNLHPSYMGLPKFKYYYLHREWFFPNHIDIALDNIKDFHKRFYPKSDLSVSLYAGLLHDAGLVYKRIESDSTGHENRSSEYVRYLLPKFGLSINFINSVCIAIESTDSNSMPTNEESFLVRNADAYSHLISIHFFAKSYFAEDIETFIDWFTKKIESTFNKLTIPDLITEVTPMIESYRRMINLYNKNKSRSSVFNNSL